MMKSFSATLLLAVLAAQLPGAAAHAAETISPDVVHFVSRMSVDEEISQLQSKAKAIPRLGIHRYVWWNEGLHGLARDGYATVFPQAIGLAATWDTQLLGTVGTVVSTEARAKYNAIGTDKDHGRYQGLTIWSPNINIFRDPRWGRGQETYGEDPFLTGTLATAFVEGLQGPDPAHPRVASSVKHFVAHSGPEPGRHGFDADVSPYDLEATYTPAFRTVVKNTGVLSVMCAYNALHGTPACANAALLTDTLRKDWNFQGYVVTDCDSVEDMYLFHNYRDTPAENAAAALKAGTDLNCGVYYRYLREAYDKHLVTKADIDRAAERVFAIRRKLGMDGVGSPWDKIGPDQIHTRRAQKLALKAAKESIVLLKNNGVLPLKTSAKIAVVGPNADTLETLEANYHGTAMDPVTPLKGLRKAFDAVSYAQGANIADGVAITIPQGVLRTTNNADARPGLTGAYFTNGSFSGKPVMTRRDRTVDLDLYNAVPVPAMAGKPYSVRWTGYIVPPAAGDYQLKVSTDRCWECGDDHDQVHLYIDGQEVTPDPKDTKALSATVHFADTRPHAVRLDFAHTGKDWGIRLQWQAPADAQRAQAVAAAQNADVIVAFVGLSPDVEGEELPVLVPGFDRGDRTSLKLPARQLALLQALKTTGKPLIVVNMSGGAVALDWAKTHADAVLQAWYPGEAGGTAIADVLDGDYNPSGHLPVTVYASVQDLPAYVDYGMAGRTYRYFTGSPLYGFGYGLSYTSYRYDALGLPATVQAGNPAEVSVRVTNTGARAGDAVAQLYLTPPKNDAGLLRSLAGMQRVHLKPGQSRVLHFTLSPSALSMVQHNGTRVQTPGSFGVFVGGAQPGEGDGASGTLTLTGEKVLAK